MARNPHEDSRQSAGLVAELMQRNADDLYWAMEQAYLGEKAARIRAEAEVWRLKAQLWEERNGCEGLA